MIKRLIQDQEIEFKPMGLAEERVALLTAGVRLLGIQYHAVAIAVLYQEPDGEPQDGRDPYGTYRQVAADPRWQEELDRLCPQLTQGRHLQTTKIGDRDYVVFFTPFFE